MENNDMNTSGVTMKNFMLEVRRSLLVNRKTLLIVLSAIFGTYILAGVLMGMYHYGGGKGEIIMYSFLMLLFGTVGASMIFSDLKTKEQRIDNLMVPASVFSKFLVRWIFAVPVLFLLFVAAYYIGDWIRILSFIVSHSDYSEFPNFLHTPDPWKFWSLENRTMDQFGPIVFCMALGSYFMNQSFYFLGAVMWPKFSFGKTLVSLTVLQTLFGIILSSFLKNYAPVLMYDSDDAAVFLWSVFSGMVILTLACYILAYYRYRRTQVVYHIFG